MKRSVVGALCALLALVSLSACTPTVAQTTPPVPTVIITPTPEQLTEKAVRASLEDEEYHVRELTPYQGDFLAWVSEGTANEKAGGWSALYWIFGDTGRRVWLNREITDQEISDYKITTYGAVEITVTGANMDMPAAQGPGGSYTVVITVDSQGRVLSDYEEGQSVVLWENQAHGGWFPLDNPGYISGESYFFDRYEQVYEVRIGIDDLALSFIPSSAPGRFRTFFPAATSAPTSDCSFDPETRIFTIRLYNTTLKSGEASEGDLEWAGSIAPYGGLYPRTIPEGSLGQGNHFIESASIAQDGEDAVITLTLTEAAYAYKTDSGNMGSDDFPYLRYSFREHVSYMDEETP